jgi:hypothetical protein
MFTLHSIDLRVCLRGRVIFGNSFMCHYLFFRTKTSALRTGRTVPSNFGGSPSAPFRTPIFGPGMNSASSEYCIFFPWTRTRHVLSSHGLSSFSPRPHLVPSCNKARPSAEGSWIFSYQLWFTPWNRHHQDRHDIRSSSVSRNVGKGVSSEIFTPTHPKALHMLSECV